MKLYLRVIWHGLKIKWFLLKLKTLVCLLGKHDALSAQHYLDHYTYAYDECSNCEKVRPNVYQNSCFARTHWGTKSYWEDMYPAYKVLWTSLSTPVRGKKY
jgi:hypothetical protein